MKILGQIPDEEFLGRQAEIERIGAMTESGRGALLFGGPRVGKSELLRKYFDLIFDHRGRLAPVYFQLKTDRPDEASRAYLACLLAQLMAFGRGDPRLIALSREQLSVIADSAPPEDRRWVKIAIDSFSSAAQSGDLRALIRSAFDAPIVAASHTGLTPLIMLDDVHIMGPGIWFLELARAALGSDSAASLVARGGPPVYLICGLRRPLREMIPPEENFFYKLDIIQLEKIQEGALSQVIEQVASSCGIRMSDATIELMIHQTGGDLFYTRALLVAASRRGFDLRTFMNLERIYAEEVVAGRIAHYLGALLSEVAHDWRSQRAALELLAALNDSGSRIPIESALERLRPLVAKPEALLRRMAARELIDMNYGFVGPAPDPVLADYVKLKYNTEVAGARAPLVGSQLVSEKLKYSYQVMMARYNRSIESQLVEALSRFDFQSVPASLFDFRLFEDHYRGMSRVQILRQLPTEPERIRLPQIVLVNDIGSDERSDMRLQLFKAEGFEGGIYSHANEVIWLIALINSRDQVDLSLLEQITRRLEPHGRQNAVYWYISKEGFSAAAYESIRQMSARSSTYYQLELLRGYLIEPAGVEAARRPANEFELTIPVDEDTELIAARTIEQIARAADFDQESINQIKTALIEACLNAAEHGESPDQKIHQRFVLEEDRLIITVSNKGKPFTEQPSAPSRRGRGLKIIRALMDEVRFERTDEGTSLVMVKFFRRPEEKK